MTPNSRPPRPTVGIINQLNFWVAEEYGESSEGGTKAVTRRTAVAKLWPVNLEKNSIRGKTPYLTKIAAVGPPQGLKLDV